jgi:Ca2+/Na+ antiporter
MAPPFPDVPENITGLVDLIKHAANVVDTNSPIQGLFGLGILIVIATVSFIGAKVFSSEKAFTFSGFLTLLSAILLRFMGFISDGIMYGVVILFTAVVIWLWSSRQQDVGA